MRGCDVRISCDLGAPPGPSTVARSGPVAPLMGRAEVAAAVGQMVEIPSCSGFDEPSASRAQHLAGCDDRRPPFAELDYCQTDVDVLAPLRLQPRPAAHDQRFRPANRLPHGRGGGQTARGLAGRPALPLVVLLLGTGLRRGEALGLHWRDVDLAAGVLRVRWTIARVGGELVFTEPKTERSRRFVSLPAPVVDVLRRYRNRAAAAVWQPWPDHGDLVFPTHVGTPTDPRNALRAFSALAERAGLAHATLHTLRHSAASALIASGAHLKVVQEMLGHSSYGITADISTAT